MDPLLASEQRLLDRLCVWSEVVLAGLRWRLLLYLVFLCSRRAVRATSRSSFVAALPFSYRRK